MPAARTGWLLVLPALLLLAALTVYPVAYGIWISFFSKHSFFPEQEFVGFGTYAAVLADEEYWRSLELGLIYSLTTIALQLVIGVAAALLLNEAFPGRGLARAVSIFPYVVPTVVAVIIWKWLLNSQFGLVNYLLGIPVSWMGRDWIMVSLIIVSVCSSSRSCCSPCSPGCRPFRRSSTRRPRSTAQAPGGASFTSPCPSCKACCSWWCCCARSGCSPSSTRPG